MATSVEAYLNEKFPSYELLKTRLEEEQTELRTEEDQTRERAETERQLILENRKNALEKLQEHLNSINPDSELVPFEGSTLSQLATDVYSDDLLSDVRATYSQFKVLASARDVVRDLKAIKEIQPTFSKTSVCLRFAV
jgi:vacuolar-type H+-ATPase subunit I/STV1